MPLQGLFLQLIERRKAERRQPFAVLSVAEAEALLTQDRYTGPVTVMWACGVKKEIHVPMAPLRIVLDKVAADPDSERGKL